MVPCQSIIPSTALCLTLLVAGEVVVNRTRCSGERRQAKHLGRCFCRRCPRRRRANTGWGGRKSREALLSCHCCSSSSGLREDLSTLVDGGVCLLLLESSHTSELTVPLCALMRTAGYFSLHAKPEPSCGLSCVSTAGAGAGAVFWERARGQLLWD